jgi:hypothetical protein
LSLQLLEVTNRQFEDVGFLESSDRFAFCFDGDHHQVLEVVEALVDAGAPLSFEDGLHHFAVLVAARHVAEVH